MDRPIGTIDELGLTKEMDEIKRVYQLSISESMKLHGLTEDEFDYTGHFKEWIMFMFAQQEQRMRQEFDALEMLTNSVSRLTKIVELISKQGNTPAPGSNDPSQFN